MDRLFPADQNALAIGASAILTEASSDSRLQEMMACRNSAQARDGELKRVLSAGQFSQYEQKKRDMHAQLKKNIETKQKAPK
jgi:hypothetical protein